jgi:hypothetical protein
MFLTFTWMEWRERMGTLIWHYRMECWMECWTEVEMWAQYMYAGWMVEEGFEFCLAACTSTILWMVCWWHLQDLLDKSCNGASYGARILKHLFRFPVERASYSSIDFTYEYSLAIDLAVTFLRIVGTTMLSSQGAVQQGIKVTRVGLLWCTIFIVMNLGNGLGIDDTSAICRLRLILLE